MGIRNFTSQRGETEERRIRKTEILDIEAVHPIIPYARLGVSNDITFLEVGRV